MPVSPSAAGAYELPELVEPSSPTLSGEDDELPPESAQLLQAKAPATDSEENFDEDGLQSQTRRGESEVDGKESHIEALIARVRIRPVLPSNTSDGIRRYQAPMIQLYLH